MDSDILNLSGLVALDIEEAEHDYHVFAKAKNRPLECPHCNGNDFVGFGRKEQLVRDELV